MNKWTQFGLLTGTLLVTASGCEISLQEQLVGFSRDFFLQALVAYLL